MLEIGESATIDGQWDDGTGTVIEISGTKVTWPGGNEVKLATKGKEKCAFQRGHNTYEGVLMADGKTLVWPGGVVWVRRQEKKSTVHENDHAERPKAGSCRSVSSDGVQSGSKPKLTLKQALDLQKELYAGFANQRFQEQLGELNSQHGLAHQSFAAARSMLFLTVQRDILPKYGFEGSQRGVIEMLHAAAYFNDNEEYIRNRERLNKLLGFKPAGTDEAENCPSASAQPEMPSESATIAIIARHAFDDVELELSLPKTATFHDVKSAIAKQVGNNEILERGRLVKKQDGAYSAYNDYDSVGEVRFVFVFRAQLTV